jgi:hypothetical protein
MDTFEAKAVVSEEKQRRVNALSAAAGRGVSERVRKVAASMLLDINRFDGWVEERGGEEGFMRWLCAQVAEGCTLKGLSVEYSASYGLLWEFMSSVPERLERYYRAQKGVADAWVGEVVEIADDKGEDVAERKWRGQARMMVAGKYDRPRFGEREQAGVVIDMRDRKNPEELLAEVRALVGGNPVLAGKLAELGVGGMVEEVLAEVVEVGENSDAAAEFDEGSVEIDPNELPI